MASYRFKSGDVMLLLLLLLPGTLTHNIPISSRTTDFEVVVQNDINDTPDQNYNATLPYRTILLGGLRKLMDSEASFRFSYTEDPNYGPYLESVNGVKGSKEDHTYWELLVKEPSGKTIRPDVGIGCYIPSENEKIILKFTHY